jgi:hypothetical protein
VSTEIYKSEYFLSIGLSLLGLKNKSSPLFDAYSGCSERSHSPAETKCPDNSFPLIKMGAENSFGISFLPLVMHIHG